MGKYISNMISIITPVYNGEKHIESCINVVVNQHCKDAEHIIIDGGSTDETVNIIKQYAENFPHIRWISEKDKGQSEAMNKGIGMAKGNILSFLNVDDYYEPDVLNHVIKLFAGQPEPTLMVGNCNVWNNDGSLGYVNKPAKLKITDLLLGCDINPHPVNPSAYFYHKSLHKEIGLYNVDEHYALDVDFILKAVKVAHIKYFDETWGNFCMLEGAKTVVDKENGSDILRMKNLLEQHKRKLSSQQRIRLSLLNFLQQVSNFFYIYLNKVKGKCKRAFKYN